MYKAIMDRIIVRLCDCPHNKFITLSVQTPRTRGVVLDIGSDVHGVKIGDEIIFRAFEELPLPQKNVAVIREKSVLGILDNNSD